MSYSIGSFLHRVRACHFWQGVTPRSNRLCYSLSLLARCNSKIKQALWVMLILNLTSHACVLGQVSSRRDTWAVIPVMPSLRHAITSSYRVTSVTRSRGLKQHLQHVTSYLQYVNPRLFQVPIR